MLPAFTGEDLKVLKEHCRSACVLRRLAEEILMRKITCDYPGMH